MPTIIEPTKNNAAFAMIQEIIPKLTAPVVTNAETTARMIRPSTSSITAAPRTICASFVCNLPKSLKTRAVIPTEVAVSDAPRKRYTLRDKLGRSHGPTTQVPSTNGTITPINATTKAFNPTFFIVVRLDSRPTWKRRIITPSSDKKVIKTSLFRASKK